MLVELFDKPIRQKDRLLDNDLVFGGKQIHENPITTKREVLLVST